MKRKRSPAWKNIIDIQERHPLYILFPEIRVGILKNMINWWKIGSNNGGKDLEDILAEDEAIDSLEALLETQE